MQVLLVWIVQNIRSIVKTMDKMKGCGMDQRRMKPGATGLPDENFNILETRSIGKYRGFPESVV